jgi:uncharacterized protein
MKLSIGRIAIGDNFFERENVINDLYEALNEGGNLLLSAPRRVGKTSVIQYIQDNPRLGYYPVYVDTEDINDSNNFFKTLLMAILDVDNKNKFQKAIEKAGKKVKGFFSSIDAIDIAGVLSIDFDDKESSPIDYYEKFKSFLDNIDLDGNKILLLVDEFPVTIEQIRDESGEEAAKNFLKLNRAIRQNGKLNKKISFIYTGSIGLLSVVRRINATADINDIQQYKLKPLSESEAMLLTSRLLASYSIHVEEHIINYLLIEKIEWFIPFHIQLAVKEIRDHYRIKAGVVDKAFIDSAFNELILNGSLYLEHYRGRLSQVFNRFEVNLAHEILKKLSNTNSISEYELHDLAVKHDLSKSFKSIMLTLEYDGYITEVDDKKWRFYSPILKQWWSKNV